VASARPLPLAEFFVLGLTCCIERIGIFQSSGERSLHCIMAVYSDVTVCLRRVLEAINNITSRDPALAHVRRHRFRGIAEHIEAVRVGLRKGAHDLV
jgi:hypothetical protein